MPYCIQCGAELKETSRFCPECGTPVAQSETQPEAAAEQTIPTEEAGIKEEAIEISAAESDETAADDENTASSDDVAADDEDDVEEAEGKTETEPVSAELPKALPKLEPVPIPEAVAETIPVQVTAAVPESYIARDNDMVDGELEAAAEKILNKLDIPKAEAPADEEKKAEPEPEIKKQTFVPEQAAPPKKKGGAGIVIAVIAVLAAAAAGFYLISSGIIPINGISDAVTVDETSVLIFTDASETEAALTEAVTEPSETEAAVTEASVTETEISVSETASPEASENETASETSAEASATDNVPVGEMVIEAEHMQAMGHNISAQVLTTASEDGVLDLSALGSESVIVADYTGAAEVSMDITPVVMVVDFGNGTFDIMPTAVSADQAAFEFASVLTASEEAEIAVEDIIKISFRANGIPVDVISISVII
ncbi:MAG: zinc-ribbon domain-containing protein [Huintestinicola sp.]